MIELRKMTDIDSLMKWREEVILNVFGVEGSQELLESNREYYKRHIPAGTHRAFLAVMDGEEAGVGGICLSEELPSPDNPSGKCTYLMNIYVREPYRKHGVAGIIISHLTELAHSLGCGKIYLEATDMAKPLYRECGFNDMENMMKYED